MRPPSGSVDALTRPRLDDALIEATDAHRITVVNAPAGYGKTTALGHWVRHSGVPYAWLSMDRFDAAPARLFRWVVASLQAAAGFLPLPDRTSLLALDGNLHHDPAASYDRVIETLGNLAEPVVLVVDDLHLPGRKLGLGILGVLASSGPSSLRLVFSSRGAPLLPPPWNGSGTGKGSPTSAAATWLSRGTRPSNWRRSSVRRPRSTSTPCGGRRPDGRSP